MPLTASAPRIAPKRKKAVHAVRMDVMLWEDWVKERERERKERDEDAALYRAHDKETKNAIKAFFVIMMIIAAGFFVMLGSGIVGHIATSGAEGRI